MSQQQNFGSGSGGGGSNVIAGTVTTTNTTPTTLLTFPFNTNTGPGTYLFDLHHVAYDLTAQLSAGYQQQVCVRWDGTNGHLIEPPDLVTIEEGALIGADIAFTVSGANLLIVVTGIGTDTIHWKTSGTYIYVN